MAMSNENEEILLSQGALGSPRDRHDGAPDAIGSTVLGRESGEGTAGVVLGSAPADQAATAEIDSMEVASCVAADAPATTINENTATQIIEEKKRKALTSPGSESNGDEGPSFRRPIKARVIETVHSCVNDNSDEAMRKNESGADDVPAAEVSVTFSEKSSTLSAPELPITRVSAKKNKEMKDYSRLDDTQEQKSNKYKEVYIDDGAVARSYRSSSERREKYFNSLVMRVQKENTISETETGSDDDWSRSAVSDRKYKKKKSKRINRNYSGPNIDSDGTSDFCPASKKAQKEKRSAKRDAVDYIAEKSTTKAKKKPLVTTIVPKIVAEKELQQSREDWLKMEPAALGERCLAHLAELEQQRKRCSNISGTVAGRMESRQIATEITKAMIEKLTTVGDVFSLRVENSVLKEELRELKRKEQVQNNIISNLQKTMANLEREVRSLKESYGPFSVAKTRYSTHVDKETLKRSSTPQRKRKKLEDREKDNTPAPPKQQDVNRVEMEIEPLLGNTPGCSTDADYTERELQWSKGKDGTPWNTRIVEINPKFKNSKLDSLRLDLNTKNFNSNNSYNRNNTNIRTNSYPSRLNEAAVESDNSNKLRKDIKVIENRQLVLPRNPVAPYRPPDSDEWVRVGGRGKRARILPNKQETINPRQRITNLRNKTAKLSKKLIKPAVVTITSKHESATYAEILAKARERVSLKELGIQTTVIRRAMNGAIITEVPGPQGKQLATTLKTRLAEVLGDEVN